MDTISKEMRAIAEKIVKDHKELETYIDLDNIEFVLRDKAKKDRIAEMRTHTFPTTLYSSKQFTMSAFLGFDELNDKKKYLVIYHELLHINPDDPSTLMGHDVEDFECIIKEHGTSWLEDTK